MTSSSSTRVPPTVRQATVADVDTVAVLFDGYRQFYGQASNLALATEFLQARLEREESVVLLAENAEGLAVGFTQLYPSFSSVSAARTFILNDLFVRPQARRSGVAQALLTGAAEWARERGAIRLGLSTALDNHPAQALYRAQGWVQDQQFLHFNLAV